MSVMELMVATAILSLVMAGVFTAVVSVQRTMGSADLRIQTNDQVRLAVADIDRQVRSGNVLYDPALETIQNTGVAAGYSLRVYTQANATQKCVQWRVLNKVLQTRAWAVTWQTDGNVSGWRNVAYDIVNTSAPFSLDPTAAYGGRLVNVDLLANASPSSASNVANVEDKISVTGRNTTEYGNYQAVCNPVPTP